jgi:hypothetical protein
MMLHCAELRFTNDKGAEICVKAPPDGDFAAFMAEKGLCCNCPGQTGALS